MIDGTNKELIKNKLYEICKDCHCQLKDDPFCTLIELLTHTTRDSRYLIQIKCIEKFQYIRAKDLKRPVSMSEATELWIAEGWATLFAKHYQPDMLVETLFNNIITDILSLVPYNANDKLKV